jgi:hypothetical protein
MGTAAGAAAGGWAPRRGFCVPHAQLSGSLLFCFFLPDRSPTARRCPFQTLLFFLSRIPPTVSFVFRLCVRSGQSARFQQLAGEFDVNWNNKHDELSFS